MAGETFFTEDGADIEVIGQRIPSGGNGEKTTDPEKCADDERSPNHSHAPT